MPTRISPLFIGELGALTMLFSHPSFAALCALPDNLQNQVTNRYPETHVVALSDLGSNDKVLFTKEHGDTCPGLSSVNFYGDGRPTLAISLVSNNEHEKKALLIVAHQVSDAWSVERIDAADSSTPVVWDDKPGKYTDVYGNKKLRATRPVIVWCAYESWAILYAWTGSTVSKIWMSD